MLFHILHRKHCSNALVVQIILIAYLRTSYAILWNNNKHLFKKNKGLFPQISPDDINAGRIVNGKAIDIEDRPWNVAIFYSQGQWDCQQSYLCTGSIIAENWVVTAAHCRISLVFDRYYVLHGQKDKCSKDASSMKKIARFITHDTFNAFKIMHDDTADGDIALIQIEGKFTPWSSTTNKIELAPPIKSWNFISCETTGWGLPSKGDLLRVGQDLVSATDCRQKIYDAVLSDLQTNNNFDQYVNYIKNAPKVTLEAFKEERGLETDSDAYKFIAAKFKDNAPLGDKLCAWDLKNRRPGICYGDSGGPLVCQHKGKKVLVGVSHGVFLSPDNAGVCADDLAAPGMYTRVTKYTWWMATITNNFGLDHERPCPPSSPRWLIFNDIYQQQTFCYRESTRKDGSKSLKKFDGAKKACLKKTTTLATPHGQDVDGFDMFPYDDVTRWTGISFDPDLHMYTYVNGVPFDSQGSYNTPWSKDLNISNGMERASMSRHCLVVKNNRWAIESCDQKFQFLCEFAMCPEKWIYNPHTARCNKVITKISTAFEASRECELYGAIIETAKSAEATEFIKQISNQVGSKKQMWLGGMNFEHDRQVWRWFDGSVIKWMPSYVRLDNYDVYGDCLLIDALGTWRSYRCDLFAAMFVCGIITCKFPYQSVAMGTDHQPLFHKCYRCLSELDVNAREAAQFCARDGFFSNPAKLASYSTKMEQKILTQKDFLRCSSQRNWVGYTYNRQAGKWQWNDNMFDNELSGFDNNDEDLKNSWPDKSKKNNGAKLKNEALNNRMCVVSFRDENVWGNELCNHIAGFICEKEQPYKLTTCTLPADRKNFWQLFNDGRYPRVPQSIRMKCFYKPKAAITLSYGEANRHCSSIGGHLILPTSTWRLYWIFSKLKVETDYIWVGADRIGPTRNTMKAFDGSELPWTNWAAHEPNGRWGNDGCTAIYLVTSKMNEWRCTSNWLSVVCEVDHNNARAYRNFDAQVACQPLGKENVAWNAGSGDMCYYTLEEAGDLNQYLHGCLALGEHSKIATNFDINLIRSLVLSNSKLKYDTAIFIGLYKPEGTSSFLWINKVDKENIETGDPPKESYWWSGSENDPESRCVAMDQRGRWSPHPCEGEEWRTVGICQQTAVASLYEWVRWSVVPHEPPARLTSTAALGDISAVALALSICVSYYLFPY